MNKQERAELRDNLLGLITPHNDATQCPSWLHLGHVLGMIDQLDAYESVVEAAINYHRTVSVSHNIDDCDDAEAAFLETLEALKDED